MGVSIGTRSVVFTDLVGSTELRSAVGEDEADRLRRLHDSLLIEAVQARGGEVVKGLGDGILATFGSAADAVSAAIAMQQVAHRDGLSIRVGASVGDVSVENGDVFGVPVVEASRLCHAATGGEILVADLVRALSRGRGGFRCEPIGNLLLKGLPDPLPTCRVSWAPLAAPAQVAERLPLPDLLVDGGSISYVGRRDLLDELGRQWARARDGEPRVVLLAGEPGIGKTRTAFEIARTANAEGAVVLYGRCDEDLGVPYQPFVEALDWYMNHAVAPQLGRLPGELGRLLPDMRSRLPGAGEPVATDPRTAEHRLFEAAASWLHAASNGSGMVLVLDDLHWATKPTLLLLLHLLRASASSSARLLVIGTYRDTDIDRAHPLAGVLADLRRLPGVERVSLDGLSTGDVERFLEIAAGHELAEQGRTLAAALHRETEGNPFFVGEVLRHLIEIGQVQRKGDRWGVVDAHQLDIPEGVRDVVSRRLNRLSANANAVLAVASVLGREIDLTVLLPLVDFDEEDVLDAVDEAVRARLLQEMAADTFLFAHALVRTTLYEQLSATRRHRLHRRTADVLEKLRPDDVVALAHHTVEAGPDGGDYSRAVRYTLAAGEQALARHAVAEADHRFRQALELLEDGAIDNPAIIDALSGLGVTQRDQGQPAFRDTLLRASRLALARNDLPRLIRAVLANHRGVASIVGGVDHERVDLIDEALAAIGPDPTSDRARLLAHLAGEVAFLRSADDRRRLAEEAVAIAESLGDDHLLVWVTVRTGFSLFDPESWRSLPDRLSEVTAMADEIGDPALRVQARFWLGAVLCTSGQFAGAEAAYRHGARIAHAETSPLLRWVIEAPLAQFHLARGEFEEAEQQSARVRDLGHSLGEGDADAWWAAAVASVALARGELESVADAVGAFAQAFPGAMEWSAAHAWFLAECGRMDEARAVLSTLDLRSDIDDLTGRPFPFQGAAELCWAAYLLGDVALASRVEEILEPYADAWAHYVLATTGPVRIPLALAAATRGDLDLAIERMERAISEATRQLWAIPSFIHSTYLASFLIDRGRPEDRSRARNLLQVAQSAAAVCGAFGRAEHASRLLANLDP